MLNEFITALLVSGIDVGYHEIVADGTLRRFHNGLSGGHEKDSWYVLNELPDGKFIGAYGDWKLGINCKYVSNGIGKLPIEYVERRNTEIAAARAKKAQAEVDASKKANKILNSKKTILTNNHPYIVRKQLTVSAFVDKYNLLLVPLYDDSSNKMSTLQFIDASGNKRFLTGGKKKGCYFPYGNLANPEIIYVCEGYATAISIYMAVASGMVAAAMDAGNLVHVVKVLLKKYPESRIVVCADDDRFSKINTGVEAANLVRKEVGIDYITPIFENEEEGTDFNDLMVQEGIPRVREIIGIQL